jgi:hypothetical protein
VFCRGAVLNSSFYLFLTPLESHGYHLRSFSSLPVFHFAFILYPNGRETRVSHFFMCLLRYYDCCLLYLEISFEEIHVTDYTRNSKIWYFEKKNTSSLFLCNVRRWKFISVHAATAAMIQYECVLLFKHY